MPPDDRVCGLPGPPVSCLTILLGWFVFLEKTEVLFKSCLKALENLEGKGTLQKEPECVKGGALAAVCALALGWHLGQEHNWEGSLYLCFQYTLLSKKYMYNIYIFILGQVVRMGGKESKIRGKNQNFPFGIFTGWQVCPPNSEHSFLRHEARGHMILECVSKDNATFRKLYLQVSNSPLKEVSLCGRLFMGAI